MDYSSKSDKKGFGFEYTVSDMFQMQGYFSRRGIPLQYGNTKQDATDVDIIGIKFIGLFEKQVIICDCKNKARSKPYERIFWAKGLGEFVNASTVYVALNKTQSEIIDFASTGGVKVLTSDIIAQYSSNSNPYGLSDASYFGDFEKGIDKVLKNNPRVSSVFSSYKKLFLSDNPYLTLNIAMADIEELWKELKIFPDNNNEVNMALRFLICELTSIVGIQLLSICSDVLGLPEKARREKIRNKLTFGEMEPEAVLSIIKNARDLANEIIKSSVPKSVSPKEVDFGEISAPPYTDNVIGLVERALAKPQMYLSIPQLLDFMLFEQGLKGKLYVEDEFVEIFGYGVSDKRIKASRNILAFVRSSCGIDWNFIWGRNKDISTQKLEDISSTNNKKNKSNSTELVTNKEEIEVEIEQTIKQHYKVTDSKNE